MRGWMARGLLLAVGPSSLACILRPGTNPDCVWPPEEPRILVLANAADRRHLVIDAELIEELVDRYRFHVPNQQPQCESKLIETVARTHAVEIRDVAQAREHVSDRGLNLPVLVPVAGVFVWTALALTRRIERRFSDERVPHIISLGIASIALSMLFVLVGEFWTSVLQMIRVGSQHVGGRVARLPWKQHEPEILVIGIVLFWSIAILRRARLSRRFNKASSDATVRARTPL
jgi:hypothetical protein